MKFFGYELKRIGTAPRRLDPVAGDRGWTTIFSAGRPETDFQRDIRCSPEAVLSFHAVFACITLIAGDISKLRPKLVKQDTDGIWGEYWSAAFSPVLRKPNGYQNHIQFKQAWITSKLTRGNAYILKERDARNVVTKLHVLDPDRVQVLVDQEGSVWYQLNRDALAGFSDADVTVPASEIIHDRVNCLFHPLVGVSPIYACGLAASQGLSIQRDSTLFFSNNAQPGGILTAPGAISKDAAERVKKVWDENYTGINAGRIAVMGDGLEYKPLRMTSLEAQLIEQLKMTAEVVCTAFHVPPFKIGQGAIPAGQKVGDLNQIYYTDCLQSLIEEMELCLSEGLGLDGPAGGTLTGLGGYDIELDLDGLLRMDQATQADVLAKLVGAAIASPNEARKRMNMGPVAGGSSPMIQQQNWSLAQLAGRGSPPDEAGPTTSKSLVASAGVHWRAYLDQMEMSRRLGGIERRP